MIKLKEEYAKELQGKTLSKPEALWYFGNEGEIRNYFGGRKKEFTGYTAKTFKKTLEQYFETVDDTVKVGRGKGYKLGVAKQEVSEREDNRVNNGKIDNLIILKNKKEFLNNQHLYKEYEDEKWLPVRNPKFSSFYYISNYGRIFSFKSNKILKGSKQYVKVLNDNTLKKHKEKTKEINP